MNNNNLSQNGENLSNSEKLNIPLQSCNTVNGTVFQSVSSPLVWLPNPGFALSSLPHALYQVPYPYESFQQQCMPSPISPAISTENGMLNSTTAPGNQPISVIQSSNTNCATISGEELSNSEEFENKLTSSKSRKTSTTSFRNLIKINSTDVDSPDHMPLNEKSIALLRTKTEGKSHCKPGMSNTRDPRKRHRPVPHCDKQTSTSHRDVKYNLEPRPTDPRIALAFSKKVSNSKQNIFRSEKMHVKKASSKPNVLVHLKKKKNEKIPTSGPNKLKTSLKSGQLKMSCLQNKKECKSAIENEDNLQKNRKPSKLLSSCTSSQRDKKRKAYTRADRSDGNPVIPPNRGFDDFCRKHCRAEDITPKLRKDEIEFINQSLNRPLSADNDEYVRSSINQRHSRDRRQSLKKSNSLAEVKMLLAENPMMHEKKAVMPSLQKIDAMLPQDTSSFTHNSQRKNGFNQISPSKVSPDSTSARDATPQHELKLPSINNSVLRELDAGKKEKIFNCLQTIKSLLEEEVSKSPNTAVKKNQTTKKTSQLSSGTHFRVVVDDERPKLVEEELNLSNRTIPLSLSSSTLSQTLNAELSPTKPSSDSEVELDDTPLHERTVYPPRQLSSSERKDSMGKDTQANKHLNNRNRLFNSLQERNIDKHREKQSPKSKQVIQPDGKVSAKFEHNVTTFFNLKTNQQEKAIQPLTRPCGFLETEPRERFSPKTAASAVLPGDIKAAPAEKTIISHVEGRRKTLVSEKRAHPVSKQRRSTLPACTNNLQTKPALNEKQVTFDPKSQLSETLLKPHSQSFPIKKIKFLPNVTNSKRIGRCFCVNCQHGIAISIPGTERINPDPRPLLSSKYDVLLHGRCLACFFPIDDEGVSLLQTKALCSKSETDQIPVKSCDNDSTAATSTFTAEIRETVQKNISNTFPLKFSENSDSNSRDLSTEEAYQKKERTLTKSSSSSFGSGTIIKPSVVSVLPDERNSDIFETRVEVKKLLTNRNVEGNSSTKTFNLTNSRPVSTASPSNSCLVKPKKILNTPEPIKEKIHVFVEESHLITNVNASPPTTSTLCNPVVIVNNGASLASVSLEPENPVAVISKNVEKTSTSCSQSCDKFDTITKLHGELKGTLGEDPLIPAEDVDKLTNLSVTANMHSVGLLKNSGNVNTSTDSSALSQKSSNQTEFSYRASNKDKRETNLDASHTENVFLNPDYSDISDAEDEVHDGGISESKTNVKCAETISTFATDSTMVKNSPKAGDPEDVHDKNANSNVVARGVKLKVKEISSLSQYLCSLASTKATIHYEDSRTSLITTASVASTSLTEVMQNSLSKPSSKVLETKIRACSSENYPPHSANSGILPLRSFTSPCSSTKNNDKLSLNTVEKQFNDLNLPILPSHVVSDSADDRLQADKRVEPKSSLKEITKNVKSVNQSLPSCPESPAQRTVGTLEIRKLQQKSLCRPEAKSSITNDHLVNTSENSNKAKVSASNISKDSRSLGNTSFNSNDSLFGWMDDEIPMLQQPKKKRRRLHSVIEKPVSFMQDCLRHKPDDAEPRDIFLSNSSDANEPVMPLKKRKVSCDSTKNVACQSPLLYSKDFDDSSRNCEDKFSDSKEVNATPITTVKKALLETGLSKTVLSNNTVIDDPFFSSKFQELSVSKSSIENDQLSLDALNSKPKVLSSPHYDLNQSTSTEHSLEMSSNLQKPHVTSTIDNPNASQVQPIETLKHRVDTAKDCENDSFSKKFPFEKSELFSCRGESFFWPISSPSCDEIDAMSDCSSEMEWRSNLEKTSVVLTSLEYSGFVPKCFLHTSADHNCCSCCVFLCCSSSWVALPDELH